jgi:hypothetical protein
VGDDTSRGREEMRWWSCNSKYQDLHDGDEEVLAAPDAPTGYRDRRDDFNSG